jgi:hypothetical protein
VSQRPEEIGNKDLEIGPTHGTDHLEALMEIAALGVLILLRKSQAIRMVAAVIPRKRDPPSSALSALLKPSLLDERRLNSTTRPTAPPTRLSPGCLLLDLGIAQA